MSSSSPETCKRQNQKLICYHSENGGHFRSYCYKLMNDQRRNAKHVATFGSTILKQQHNGNEIK